MPERFGIYFAPAVTSPLWMLATQWLGRDSATGETVEMVTGGLEPARRFGLTESARRYGFHATLKAPIALDSGLKPRDLDAALKAFAGASSPIDIGPMVLRPIDGFLALVPDEQRADLTAFAAKCVTDFDPLRAPTSETDRVRRLNGGLTPRQIELLDQYGYPYVFEEFRFHMTLTDRLKGTDHDVVMLAAANWFAPVLGRNLLLDRLVLFHEAEAGAPFTRLRDYPLTQADA
jgi:putative phosphonate metabolism protein